MAFVRSPDGVGSTFVIRVPLLSAVTGTAPSIAVPVLS